MTIRPMIAAQPMPKASSRHTVGRPTDARG